MQARKKPKLSQFFTSGHSTKPKLKRNVKHKQVANKAAKSVAPEEVEQKEQRAPWKEFQYLAHDLRHEDDILNQERYLPYKKVITDSISSVLLHDLSTRASHAAVIMAKENAKKLVDLLIALHAHNVKTSANTLFVLSSAGANMGAFGDFLLNAKINNFLTTIESILESPEHLNNLALIYSSVDKKVATKVTTLLAANPTYFIALIKGFSLLIKNEIPVTDETVEQISSSIKRNPALRISNAFMFCHIQVAIPNRKQSVNAQHESKGSTLTSRSSMMFKPQSSDINDTADVAKVAKSTNLRRKSSVTM